MNFAAIIPTRDRPQFLENCKAQLSKQTLRPSKVYVIDFEPKSDEVDIVARVRKGVEMAKADGIDVVFIIEDDDFYPEDYFERFVPFLKDHEFFGDDHSTYYNIRNKTYRTWHHPYRASLFTTAFKISALNLFKWPGDNERFLDIKLWEYARRRRRKFINTGAIGIKHAIGKTGGKGHYMRMMNVDVDYQFLKSHTNGSFKFYENLMSQW